jgi:hypothetical protein
MAWRYEYFLAAILHVSHTQVQPAGVEAIAANANPKWIQEPETPAKIVREPTLHHPIGRNQERIRKHQTSARIGAVFENRAYWLLCWLATPRLQDFHREPKESNAICSGITGGLHPPHARGASLLPA